MDACFWVLVVVQSVLIILLAVVLFIFIKIILANNLENRFVNYSLTSIVDDDTPFFENVINNIWKIIKKFNVITKNSQILTKYSKHFEKYISYDDRDKKSGADYISIKIVISIVLGLIYVVSTLIRFNFDYMFLLLIMTTSFFILDLIFMLEYKNRRKKIENDLLNAIIIMNNAFKSGMNIIQAISIVETELEGPIQDEFRKINLDIKYGLSLETVFERFYNRVKIEDVKYITSSLSLINKTGGNIIRVFGAIEKNFYDKKKIKDEMNSLTSSSIFMFRLLVFMPILLAIVVFMLNPEFFLPLITEGLGRLIILMIIILYSLYIFIVKRIMKVNV